jgi:hypothetical protein
MVKAEKQLYILHVHLDLPLITQQEGCTLRTSKPTRLSQRRWKERIDTLSRDLATVSQSDFLTVTLLHIVYHNYYISNEYCDVFAADIKPHKIDVFEDTLYITTYNSNKIFKMDKFGKGNATDITHGMHKISDVVILQKYKQTQRKA